MLHSQDRLRIFCVAAEADSFRDAAARLGIPPQGVTRAVQELEAHYGELLFHRTTRSVHITDFGAELAPRVRACLEQIDAVLAPASPQAASELVGRVRVTATAILPNYSSADLADVQRECIGNGSAVGYINDNADAGLRTKKTMADCLTEYGIPVNTQIQEIDLKTRFVQVSAPT